MKVDLAVPLYSIIVLLCTCFPLTHCQTPVNCRWGPYGEWSECDGCSQTKVRTRQVQVYAQYNGMPCQGAATESVPCIAEKACPLDTGCGERLRCTSGRCISPSLVCNGDQDCEDGLDERSCDVDTSHRVCDLDRIPPNSAVTGKGYDVLTGKLKLGVIDTLRFGGQCRKVFSGDHSVFYRLPQSILRYSFEVQVNNEESDETYDSSWSYVQHVQSNALFIHDRRTFHKELSETKAHKLLILKNQVQLAQFQNSAPQYLPLAEGFWKALAALPLTYDLSAYRRILQTYGTHYMSEGSLGGEYRALLEFDQNAMQQSSTTDTEYKRCWRKVKRRLFWKKVKTTCEKLTQALKSSSGHDSNHLSVKTTTIGGDPAFSGGALKVLELENPQANRESYDTWASSVKDFPDVINKKLRPVYELVKEVRCAGLKKMHLKRALEELLAEEHPCHCGPCHNNGQPLLTGTQCSCVCRPGTSGLACERGTVTGEPPGVVHGSWSCWSSWSSCSRGQRLRSRSCSNPAPSRGGQHCIGLENETSPCEHPDVHYLQMMEPQCFGLSVALQKTCGAPPGLRNGFVVNPQEIYLVGNRIEYSCIDGHFLSGDAVAECTDNQKWTTGQMVCKSATCGPPLLSGDDVTFTPTKAAYQIGDRVTLSCPAGAALRGHVTDSMCNPSLQWSPSLEEARCIEVPKVAATPPPPALNCKPWQTAGKAQCVCKMPFQCEPSVKLCARLGSRTRLLGSCQLGALQCVGRSFTLAKDTDCDWPKETFTSCQNCNPGEKCNESATDCVCRDPAECPEDSTQMCVTPEDGSVAVTMTECELGARRCAGEQVTVVGLEACQT